MQYPIQLTKYHEKSIIKVRHIMNILAIIGAFYFGKNVTSIFRTYMAIEKMCRSIRGLHFSCVASAAHFLFLSKIHMKGGYFNLINIYFQRRKKMKNVFKFLLITIIFVSMICLCGCSTKCTECNNVIEENNEIEINSEYYCKDCVEYCADCNTAFVKGNKNFLTFEDKLLCSDCFNKKAYPIVLEDNDKFSMSIIGYDDSDGSIAVTINNKTEYTISIFQEGDSALLDGNSRCIGETDGWHSFAYVDVPGNSDITVFSTFRKSEDEWDEILKISDNHSFEFAMKGWISDESFDGFWDTVFKVSLTPEMFGYGE